jgi:hypothetical protein
MRKRQGYGAENFQRFFNQQEVGADHQSDVLRGTPVLGLKVPSYFIWG